MYQNCLDEEREAENAPLEDEKADDEEKAEEMMDEEKAEEMMEEKMEEMM